MNLDVHFIGTGGSVPQARRGLPATAVHYGGEWLLFDCGEGTQRQLLQSVGLKNFDQIFITHMHTDHWLGLPSMLLTWTLLGREKPLTIVGPQALKDRITSLADLKPSFPIHWSFVHPTNPWQGYNDGYSVATFPVQHSPWSVGYVLQEAERPGKFHPGLADAAGFVPSEFGALKAKGTFTSAKRAGRKIVLAGDTRPCASVVEAARGADLFITEASFLEEDSALAKRANHSTAAQAAGMAKEAGVKRLAVNHILSRTSKAGIYGETGGIFETWVPNDFEQVEVPYGS